MGVEASSVPPGALLGRYEAPGDGAPAYVDSFTVCIGRPVPVAEFVTAFYTTALFRLERFVLRHAFGLPSSDDDAAAVARGDGDRFAAWTVEARTDRELLMCDVRGRTRSWFMTVAEDDGTRLYFGSAVVPAAGPRSAPDRLGRRYRWLLGLHRLYSRLLLAAARRKLAE